MKILIISALFLSLLIGNCFSGGLMKLPTQEQLDKYCIAVKLKIDGQPHYFSFFSIKSFDEEGLKIIYGETKEKINFIPKKDILNFNEAIEKYQKLKDEFGGIR